MLYTVVSQLDEDNKAGKTAVGKEGCHFKQDCRKSPLLKQHWTAK